MNKCNDIEEAIQDPDYKKTEEEQIQERVKGEKDNKERLEKIKSIINREFNKELKIRENQLENIQKRILKTKKTLHLLRYLLIKSYYNSHEIQNEEVPEEFNISSQNRIHPAIKKLLGNNADRNYIFNTLNTRPKRQKQNTCDNRVTPESNELSIRDVPKSCEVSINADVNDVIVKEECVNVPTSNARNRGKIKHRLIIGNISKWMPSENEEDNSTHKWMIYVRGPKEKPDVSPIIQKIIFYLHPSYKPYDVVEVTESPFHLSRRGWGEFPLRLQIHFNCKLNKPVDVIHNLKLDKTYRGRQTLGNETLVDIYLYHEEQEEETEPNDFEDVKLEFEYCNLENIKDDETFGLANESCFKELPNDSNLYRIHFDHNYAKTDFDSDCRTTSKRKRYLISEDSLFEEQATFKHDDNNLIDVPNGYFNNVLEILPYVLKRIPLIQDRNAIDVESNGNILPFIANSSEEYWNWNDVKKTSCEWSRAKFIKRLITKMDLLDKTNWSTKNILWYARSHGFTPYVNHNVLRNNYKFNAKQLTLENESRRIKKEFNRFHLDVKDERIDVTEFEQDDEIKSNSKELINYNELVADNDCTNASKYSFIRQTALDVGVILKYEEVIPGVVINGAERILLVAVKCLMENIIRDTHSNKTLENNRNSDSSFITSDDIYHSLKDSRLEIFLK